MDVLIVLGLLLLVLVTTLGAYDSRDGRDWQARSDWRPRHEGD
jgi:hypothetical protein